MQNTTSLHSCTEESSTTDWKCMWVKWPSLLSKAMFYWLWTNLSKGVPVQTWMLHFFCVSYTFLCTSWDLQKAHLKALSFVKAMCTKCWSCDIPVSYCFKSFWIKMKKCWAIVSTHCFSRPHFLVFFCVAMAEQLNFKVAAVEGSKQMSLFLHRYTNPIIRLSWKETSGCLAVYSAGLTCWVVFINQPPVVIFDWCILLLNVPRVVWTMCYFTF